MNKEELIEKLRDYKSALQNQYCDLDSIISNVMSDVCDYDNDNDFSLDSYTYYYESTDWIEEFVKYTVDTCWLLTLKNRLSEVDGDYDWYHVDDTDWTIYPRDFSDVEEWIDDILYELDDEENEPTD